jgi:hypothetical protein
MNVKESVGEHQFSLIGGQNSTDAGFYTKKPFSTIYSVQGSYEVTSSNDYEIKGRIYHNTNDVTFRLRGDFIAYKCGVSAKEALIIEVNKRLPKRIKIKNSEGREGFITIFIDPQYKDFVEIVADTTDSEFEKDWSFRDSAFQLYAGKLSTTCEGDDGYLYRYMGNINPNEISFDLAKEKCHNKYSGSLKSLEIKKDQNGLYTLKARGQSNETYTASWSL